VLNGALKGWRMFAVVIILAIVVVGVASLHFLETSTSKSNVVELPEFTKIFSASSVGNGVVLLVGDNEVGGEAGLLYTGNMSFDPIELGNYFSGGSILSVASNGSSFLMGGYSYNGEVHVCLVSFSDGHLENLTKDLGKIINTGLIEGVAWFNSSWFVGGSTLTTLYGQGVSIPLLVQLFDNGSSRDLSADLPPYFVPEQGGLVDTINGVFSFPQGVGIVGDNAINATFTVFNGSFQNFSIKGFDQGFFFSASYTPDGWLVGGALAFPSHLSTYMMDFLGSEQENVSLPYHVGIVTSVLYNGAYWASLRVPFYPSGSSTNLQNGTVILEGTSPSSLHEVLTKEGLIVNYLCEDGNGKVLGVGYLEGNGRDEGAVVLLE